MNLRQFLSIVEIRTKIISLSTLLCGLVYSLYTVGDINLLHFFLLLVASIAVDMGTTGFNSLFDFIRGVDEKKLNREKDKVLVHEGADPNDALRVSLGCYIVAVISGGALAFLTDWRLALIGAVCMAVGFLYTGGPYPISRTPLGELFAGGFLGSVFFLIVVYVLTGNLTGHAFIVSLPLFFSIAGILSANNACDIEGDSAAGRKTLAVVLGKERGAFLVYFLGVVALLLMAFYYYYGVVPPTVRFPLGAAIIGVFFVYRHLRQLGFSHETKGPVMRLVSLSFLLTSAAFIAGYLWYMIII